ncbi:MAG: hypothetical protein IJ174_07755 [Clostridia bacterium]|nr:hypothetical protein [Clostridia bacterium]
MKKLLSLALAIMLLAVCAAPALAASHTSVYDWCYSLPKDAVFAFDYMNCKPLPASKIYNTTPQKITRYWQSYTSSYMPAMAGDNLPDRQVGPNYIITDYFGAGFEANEVTGTRSDANVIPVDLTREGTIVYPIATDSLVVAGFFWSTVKDGKLSVSYQFNQGEIKLDGKPEITVYASKTALKDKQPTVTCGAVHKIDIATELGGAQAVLIALNGKMTYNKNLFKATIPWTDKIAYTEYQEPVPGMIIEVTKYNYYTYDVSVNYTLQDYWRFAPYWQSYRAGLANALSMVAD